jgi:hypothetical protein
VGRLITFTRLIRLIRSAFESSSRKTRMSRGRFKGCHIRTAWFHPRESMNDKVEIPSDNDTVMASDMSGPNATHVCHVAITADITWLVHGACPTITDQASRRGGGDSCYICIYSTIDHWRSQCGARFMAHPLHTYIHMHLCKSKNRRKDISHKKNAVRHLLMLVPRSRIFLPWRWRW